MNPIINRRHFLEKSLLFGAGATYQSLLPAWAQSGRVMTQLPGTLSGDDLTLVVEAANSLVAGKNAPHITLNGQFPAPLLRWREGDDLTLRIINRLQEPTSIHWHGILLPFQMDGVPGLSFPGIPGNSEFVYRFPVKQAGTYWYHSHSGLQEQLGHYGPIIIDPVDPDPVAYDREHVVVLSDWTFEDPHRVFSKLKKMSDNYNFQQRTVREFFADVENEGLDAAMANRLMWGDMRMNPTDLSDVTASTYTYLVNGHSPAENWTGLFRPGERVRLRIINASAMSIFNVRIPGLPMTVVQADGLNVKPVTTDEFQIGTAETFDVIVQPEADRAFTLMCEANDRSGYAAATLAPREGMSADVPSLRPRPTLTMKDMGMSGMGMEGMEMEGMEDMNKGTMGSMVMPETSSPAMILDQGEVDHSAMNHEESTEAAMDQAAMNQGEYTAAVMDHSTPDNNTMDHAGMADMDSMNMDNMAMQTHNHSQGPGVMNVAMNPVNRLHERPLGLENVPHRVLVYTDLESLAPNPDTRPPEREMELHLTSNMERYMWSFDGVKFSEVNEPIMFHQGERLRLTLVNDTMMPHPIHLHGMFFDVVTAEHQHKPRKHTIVVKPGEKMAMDITADAIGDWAFHCHLLYHMKAGMMQIVSVKEPMT
ncbi:MAG: copper resistance system multicopper oxidase [Gammaproteobacteria bacterium]|nr:copper resistance system multicopper oxidase [Gammaproteobacteria bacterium]